MARLGLASPHPDAAGRAGNGSSAGGGSGSGGGGGGKGGRSASKKPHRKTKAKQPAPPTRKTNAKQPDPAVKEDGMTKADCEALVALIGSAGVSVETIRAMFLFYACSAR
jgi:hypothetical protein